tara:strand:+ start:25549 stop:25773 length:225 start_codon:yes stop_codon:yes gene_type:complete
MKKSIENQLNLIFLPIARDSKSPEDFITRSSIIKGVDPKISTFFYEKFGTNQGRHLSMNEAAENYLQYSKSLKN